MADWPHAPVHRLTESGAYMVTAGTYGKVHHFHKPDRLSLVMNFLFEIAEELGWRLQAWALMENHYHFIAISPDDSKSLKRLVSKLHTLSAREINRMDHTPGRKVWFQYWDTHLTYPKSYLARLNYVHHNPVHHGLVPVADQYEWCSARWFAANAEPAFYKTVMSYKTDRLQIMDDF